MKPSKQKSINQCRIDHSFMTFISFKYPMRLKVCKTHTILIIKKKDDFGWSTNHDQLEEADELMCTEIATSKTNYGTYEYEIIACKVILNNNIVFCLIKQICKNAFTFSILLMYPAMSALFPKLKTSNDPQCTQKKSMKCIVNM